MNCNLRKYGHTPFKIVLVHGGPGAPGEMQPVAKILSRKIGVLEPLQTKDTIVGQVEELKEIIINNTDMPIILLGWSWGAWLSLISASIYPEIVKKLILVSSGPLEEPYAKEIMRTRLKRLSIKDSVRIQSIMKLLEQGDVSDKNSLFQELGEKLAIADTYKPVRVTGELIETQVDIYKSVWSEAEKLRSSGVLLEYAKNIKCPVLVIHGDYDPHPFLGVKNPLSKVLKNVEFVLMKNCGHTPWLEKEARREFFHLVSKGL